MLFNSRKINIKLKKRSIKSWNRFINSLLLIPQQTSGFILNSAQPRWRVTVQPNNCALKKERAADVTRKTRVAAYLTVLANLSWRNNLKHQSFLHSSAKYRYLQNSLTLRWYRLSSSHYTVLAYGAAYQRRRSGTSEADRIAPPTVRCPAAPSWHELFCSTNAFNCPGPRDAAVQHDSQQQRVASHLQNSAM